jgi:hypothetical protein
MIGKVGREGKEFHFGKVNVPEWNGLEGKFPISFILIDTCFVDEELLQRLKPLPPRSFLVAVETANHKAT